MVGKIYTQFVVLAFCWCMACAEGACSAGDAISTSASVCKAHASPYNYADVGVEEELSLLQTTPRKQLPPLHDSFIPESGTVCFEGLELNNAVGSFRTGPLFSFSAHTGDQPGVSCAQLGFPTMALANEPCFPSATIFARAGSDINATLTELRANCQSNVFSFADLRGIDRELAMRWATCASCQGGAAAGFRWWGASRQYSESECAALQTDIPMALETATPHTGSLVPDSGVMCWEGPYDYMAAVLSRIQANPPAASLFTNAAVHDTTCLARGYEVVRDAIDECWPGSMKMMRSASQGTDMMTWLVGPPGTGLRPTIESYGSESIDLYTCGVCEVGGANRDRGMLFTQDGAAYTSRYSDAFCASLLSNVSS